ncbi:PTS glucitol/sorbitol transporter subunit IIA [Gilliamella sp. ESL0254]|uniref:PTS glucitol/sorbitol transporter subunit IIA n=1 Tax=Gilliamella sp. ESL0254 TaxID=2705035 RepID=UPI001580D61A|nr:PTS glucitol/sorbitol transporter subunit IIA [Gilliamella sp. ESL0254]NUF26931.1 PTS glucitol/sorbitol transporter subunit IIA [Gilliamella sp. ESL0254]
MAKSIITEIGSIVPEFKEEKVIILFGPMATPDLRDICVIHEFHQKPVHALTVGTQFSLGKHKYTITQVGCDANKNFEELGHISIYFKDDYNEILPGAITVQPDIFPDLNVGDDINFELEL